MKKLFIMFEDLWVAAAFAEAGVYYADDRTGSARSLCRRSAHAHAA